MITWKNGPVFPTQCALGNSATRLRTKAADRARNRWPVFSSCQWLDSLGAANEDIKATVALTEMLGKLPAHKFDVRGSHRMYGMRGPDFRAASARPSSLSSAWRLKLSMRAFAPDTSKSPPKRSFSLWQAKGVRRSASE